MSNYTADFMTVILKNSTVKGRVPSPDNLEIGEVALSLYEGEESIWAKNSKNQIIKLNSITPSSMWATENEVFKSYSSYDDFIADKEQGLISEFTVVYISDEENKGIWTRGVFYPTPNPDLYYTKTETNELLEHKQDNLIAGEGISIENNVISSTIDTDLYIIVDELPEPLVWYDDLVNVNDCLPKCGISKDGSIIRDNYPTQTLLTYNLISENDFNCLQIIYESSSIPLDLHTFYLYAEYSNGELLLGEPASKYPQSPLPIFPDIFVLPETSDEIRICFTGVLSLGDLPKIQLGKKTEIKTSKIYLVRNPDSEEEENEYTEYAWIDGQWEKLGDFKADIDLSGYAKKEEVQAVADTLEEDERVISEALNDLNKRIIDVNEELDTRLGPGSITFEMLEPSVGQVIETASHLATQEHEGLMSATDKYRIDYIYLGNVPLVSPSITGQWIVSDGDLGTEIRRTSDANITVENGCQVDWSGTYIWNTASGYKDPTRLGTGTNWNILTESGITSDVYEASTLTTNTTIKVVLEAAKTGLIVKDGSVIPSDEYDSSTASCSVTFKERSYFGKVKTATPTENDIIALTSWFSSNKNYTANGITLADDEYLVYAYPLSYGQLSQVTMDGATAVLGAFSYSLMTIPKELVESKTRKRMYVYISNYPGAFTNSNLVFK